MDSNTFRAVSNLSNGWVYVQTFFQRLKCFFFCMRVAGVYAPVLVAGWNIQTPALKYSPDLHCNKILSLPCEIYLQKVVLLAHTHFSCILLTAKLTNQSRILCMSAADLERTTKLSLFDVSILLKAVSHSLPCPPMTTALSLYNSTTQGQGSSVGQRLTVGCQILDGFLRGGILRRGITEVTGESSSGKTQICLQLCLTVQFPKEKGGLEGGIWDLYS